VLNFTISLYAFHLRHTLTDLPDQVPREASLLWENLANLGKSSLPFPGLNDLRSKLICYENGKYQPQREQGRKTEWLTDVGALDLGSLPTSEGFSIKADLQPFLLHDSYVADLTISPESANIIIDIPQVQLFQPGSLLPTHIQASLGQTLLIYGEVDPQENCQELAKKLATALVAGTNINTERCNESGFLGSLIFDYQAPDPQEPDNPVKRVEILIILNHQQANTIQLAGDAYDWLKNLLCCQHKIDYIYDLAQHRYREAREIYSYLEDKIQKFNQLVSNSQTTLAELKQLLAEVPQKNLDYTRCLQDLQIHHTSITTNVTNYQICLNKLGVIGGSVPQFWQDFLDRDCRKKTEQIQTYINYLTPGQEIFSQLVDTIRGVIETQQTESDRSLEETVQVLGIGFGGGAIISGVITANIDKIDLPIVAHKYPFYSSLYLSIIATLGFIALGWLIVKLKKR
jgi:hypothetical protein